MKENKLVSRISLFSCDSLTLTVQGQNITDLGTLTFRTGSNDQGLLYMTYQSNSENNPIALSELREALLLLADHLKEPPEVVKLY